MTHFDRFRAPAMSDAVRTEITLIAVALDDLGGGSGLGIGECCDQVMDRMAALLNVTWTTPASPMFLNDAGQAGFTHVMALLRCGLDTYADARIGPDVLRSSLPGLAAMLDQMVGLTVGEARHAA